MICTLYQAVIHRPLATSMCCHLSRFGLRACGSGMSAVSSACRFRYEAGFKAKVIFCTETVGNRTAGVPAFSVPAFSVPETCVCDWRKQRDHNTDLVIIPGGMTSQLQPLDVCLNKLVKERVRALYSEWLATGNHTFTLCNRIKCALLDKMARRGV